jgi:hypothetical protein
VYASLVSGAVSAIFLVRLSSQLNYISEAYNNNRAGSQGDGITWALCRTIFKADRNVEVNTIAQGLKLPASTRELFIAADDHKKNAIYVALPEMVVLFLSAGPVLRHPSRLS